MAEINNNNWWKKIEQSDGDKGRNRKEQSVITFLDKNRNLPPDRFAKLVEQAVEITKRRDLQEQQILSECQRALEKLIQEVRPSSQILFTLPINACTQNSGDSLIWNPISAGEIIEKVATVTANL